MTIVNPVQPGHSPDPKVNELLKQAEEGWWNDAAMFGVIAHQPELLKAIVPVFESFFIAGRLPPRIRRKGRARGGGGGVRGGGGCGGARLQAV